MNRQFADGGEPTFQRMPPWAEGLQRSGNEAAGRTGSGSGRSTDPSGQGIRWSVR
jgi:hypothetical protein